METWQFWIIAVLLALILVAVLLLGEQLKAINVLLIQINRGVWANKEAVSNPDDD